MANTKSSKKDLRRVVKRRARNIMVKSALKTYVRKARTAIAAPAPATEGPEALRAAIKALDKAAQNGIIHKNQAARRKSRLARQLHAATVTAANAPAAPVEFAAPKAPRAAKTTSGGSKAKAKAKAASA